MSFKTEISYDAENHSWNDKLLEKSYSTTYQTTNWLSTYKNAYGSRPIFISVKDSTGEIAGQLAMLIHDQYFWDHSSYVTKLFGKIVSNTAVIDWNYGPIIYDESNEEEIISSILTSIEEISLKNRIIMIRGSSPPLVNFSHRIFEKNKYTLREWSTYILDLKQSSEALYDGLNKKTRYDIRKGDQNKLEFEVVNNKDTLREFTEIGIQARAKMGEKRKLNQKRLNSDWENLYKKNMLKVFLARKNKVAIAGIWNILFNGNVIQHGVVNLPNSSIHGGPFVTWNAIKWSIENNLHSYDTGGANPNPANEKEQNIAFYKSKWGGTKYSYYVFTKILDKKRWQILNAIKHPKRVYKKLIK